MKAPEVFLGRILPRYGQSVTMTRRDGCRETGKAIIQPVLEKTGDKEQARFTPLGVKSTDCFLYLGAPDLALDQAAYVTCQGRDYVIRQAHPVWVGEYRTHWWGILRPREEGNG